ncbi:MAG TPA: tetratricopeptide repeat protein, partial [Sphingomicrobium sp.]|nr:tetratricopeptide repeat protein [Sphingomicrobium sp.]
DSWEVNKEAARLYYRQRRLEEAARHLEKATRVMEADYHGLGMLLAYYYSKSDIDLAQRTARRAVEQSEKALSRDPDNGAALAFGAMSHACLGNLDRAREWIERSLLVDPDNLQMRYNLAWGLNKIMGDPEAAVEMLEPVLANAGANIIRLAANDPNLDNLRDDPRLQLMLEQAEERVGRAKAFNPSAAT